MARLEPVGRRPRWLSRDEFIGELLAHLAALRTPGLARDLAALSDETTDDISSG